MPLHCARFVGITAAPGANFDTSGLNTDNEIANQGSTAPFPGRIRQIFVHCGGNGGAVTGNLVVWDTDNGQVILAKSLSMTLPATPSLQSAFTDNSEPANKNLRYQIGFYRTPSQSGKWFVLGSGSFVKLSTSSLVAMAGQSACAGPYICGNLQAYATLLGVSVKKEYHLTSVAMWKKRRR